MKTILIICATIMLLTGCTGTTATSSHIIYINDKVYTVEDGTRITFRDSKTGRYVPLRVEK